MTAFRHRNKGAPLSVELDTDAGAELLQDRVVKAMVFEPEADGATDANELASQSICQPLSQVIHSLTL